MSEIQVPKFGAAVIEDKRKDGYWVETFHFDKEDRVPGIVTSGLVSGMIEYLENPLVATLQPKKGQQEVHSGVNSFKPNRVNGFNGVNGHSEKHSDETNGAGSESSVWEKWEIGKFDSPVAVVAVDITQNGLMDLVICHNYGPFMLECHPKGGFVTWLENPGRENLDKGHWKERYIGRWPAMHRIKAGYFTQKTYLEVIAASVVYGPHDKTTPIPIIKFQCPDKLLESNEWASSVIDDKNFTVIHEIAQKKFEGPHGLDSMIIASREGTTRLYFEDGQWKRDLITSGEPRRPGQSATSESPGSGDHWGTGCVDVGRIGDDPFAYIATSDPFHGTTTCVYTKTNRGMNGNEWKRHVLDVYGTPNQLQHTGDGPGHYIVCADFDGDGDDEFLLALFGPLDRDENGESIPPPPGANPNKGIMYHKAIDLDKGLWAKYRIADESSARIALGDFNGKGNIDFASMSYNVARYYEEPEPRVTIHFNENMPVKKPVAESPITPTVWADEGLVYLPRPSQITSKASQSLLEVADYSISVEVYPPSTSIQLSKEEGIKVLYGSVKDGKNTRTPLGVKPFTTSSTQSSFGTVKSTEEGSVILRFVPIRTPKTYTTAGEVPVKSNFDVSQFKLKSPDFTFKKVEDLWWGEQFKNVEFYNLSGFSFRFGDQTPIVHMQFWTAGSGVNCGVHNHSTDIFQEVHVSLSAGTGNGGMARLRSEYIGTDATKLNNLADSAFDALPLPRLHEHGGMWERDSYGKAVRGKNNIVKYPYHKWQAGTSPGVDVWMALEFNPDLELS